LSIRKEADLIDRFVAAEREVALDRMRSSPIIEHDGRLVTQTGPFGRLD
jgi:hypothetical protein